MAARRASDRPAPASWPARRATLPSTSCWRAWLPRASSAPGMAPASAPVASWQQPAGLGEVAEQQNIAGHGDLLLAGRAHRCLCMRMCLAALSLVSTSHGSFQHLFGELTLRCCMPVAGLLCTAAAHRRAEGLRMRKAVWAVCRVPPIVRLGVQDSLHSSVKGLHIDVLAERQAARGAGSLESLAGDCRGFSGCISPPATLLRGA